METDTRLSEEEQHSWELLVDEGRKIREPILARREERKAAQMAAMKARVEARGGVYKPWKVSTSKDSMQEIPVRTKRWVVCRASGISFKKAGDASGASWLDVQDAKAHNEEFRCALAAMEENSRQLMKAKAHSVMEQSQDEDAKVSMAQTQMSMRILECLDREHFGEVPKDEVAEEVHKQLGGGGFVINLIQDAAKTADAVPDKRPQRALVYTDV